MRLTFTNLHTSVSSLSTPVWSPIELFNIDNNGWWYDINDVSTLFQDSTATTPVTLSGQPVGAILDKSGKGINATQATTTARPTYDITPSRVTLDAIDDNMTVNIGSAFTGTVIQGTQNGVLHYDINVSSGTWSFIVTPLYVADSAITGMVAINRELTPIEITKTTRYVGLESNFGTVTSMANWFRNRTDVTAIYANNWDTTNITNFTSFVRSATNLTTLDTSNWNTANVTSFNSFALSATNLTALDVSNWNTANVNNFTSFVSGATNLTTLDVSNWNTANVTAFNNFIQNAANITTLDVSNWNTARVTTFASFVSGANTITNLNVSNWNTANVTNFNAFARNATNLTTVTVNGGTGNPFADSACVIYTNAFTSTNLTQQSIDAILVAINAAGTSAGTFNQTGGSAPSITGESAITALRSRGWTITVTGGF